MKRLRARTPKKSLEADEAFRKTSRPPLSAVGCVALRRNNSQRELFHLSKGRTEQSVRRFILLVAVVWFPASG
jgi:hypothetical protein